MKPLLGRAPGALGWSRTTPGRVLLIGLALSGCTTPTTTPQQATDTVSESEPAVAAASPRPSTPDAPSSDPTPGSPPEASPPVDAGALVERFDLEFRDGTVRPPRTDIEIPVGDTIELAVTTDVAATLEAVGLDVSHELTAGRETVVPITVKGPGTFQIMLDATLLAVLRTTP